MNEPKRSRKKLFITIGIVVIVLIAVGSMVAARKRDQGIPVTTDKAFRKTITQLVTATGKIQPEVEVPIAPEVSGEIVELPVKEGQVVHRGELLLRIKPDSIQAQVSAQQAALSASQSSIVQHRAELAKADLDYKRALNLFNQRLLSEADRNAAQTNDDIARAALDASVFEAQRAAGALRQIDADCPDVPAKLAAYAALYADVLSKERMCLCGMMASDYATLPPAMRSAVVRFFDENESWLQGVL